MKQSECLMICAISQSTGGDATAVAIGIQQDVQEIVSNNHAFAALKASGVSPNEVRIITARLAGFPLPHQMHSALP
eukprot:1743422-Amphidinium_carterae.1